MWCMWLHLASLTAACRPPVSETRFARLAAAAISTGRPLRLTNRSVQLHAPFRLRSSQRLTIVGGDFHGDGHSLFQVEGSRQGLLDLRGVRLLHASSAERSERRESVAARKRPLHVASAGFKPPRRARGAAIFVRGKGQLALERRATRAGAASLDLLGSRLSGAAPHAICARGETRLAVRRCTIDGSAVRAIYAYHSASLEVSDCSISGTRSAEVGAVEAEAAAAVEVEALRPTDCASLSLSGNAFADNAGGDLAVRGNVAWVVGGVGIVGSGIAHGLLAAGATVIVNSRHEQRLEKISEAMGHPARLVTVGASMLPGRAEITVEQVMDMTSNQLDHVVAHAGGRPWASGGGDETSTTYNRGSVLHIPADEYASAASQLGSFHFAAASLLLPRLTDAGKGSYTFVTSSTSAAWGPRSYMTQALCVARQRTRDGRRASAERESEPRERPLSHTIGSVVAGMAAKGAGGLVQADDMPELLRLEQELR
ncbi:hypothetical protein EMIHUDRAFT_104209 [Emiliania huxleyi CCMP1516]|uniref:Pyrroline-5-carboxylate reductase catalytic N-terminal domain-containing protein n=2 Tax=Emiliania huxleyi TaxID=2903 RepID=A0A0D3IM41_EMIH1|nr:hypothetical protein EMIHUDRAFT_104209 [Emiliania huxleyi CCMP1516]EOD12326.1 hypothetical protein EMIHUDRAFT_104209 [Emiliania huxleyi CCMP1516]|eukprot:XP_005764755.1 hypothetical protein EMIHUDRAFT_104209 [Emiliania huxleyi CCMP1516]